MRYRDPIPVASQSNAHRAVATEPTLTIEFPGAELRQLCAADPVLGYDLTTRLMHVVVHRLQATRARLAGVDR